MYLLRRPLDRDGFCRNNRPVLRRRQLRQADPLRMAGPAIGRQSRHFRNALVVLAPVGVLIGAWLHARVSDRVFSSRWSMACCSRLACKLVFRRRQRLRLSSHSATPGAPATDASSRPLRGQCLGDLPRRCGRITAYPAASLPSAHAISKSAAKSARARLQRAAQQHRPGPANSARWRRRRRIAGFPAPAAAARSSSSRPSCRAVRSNQQQAE